MYVIVCVCVCVCVCVYVCVCICNILSYISNGTSRGPRPRYAQCVRNAEDPRSARTIIFIFIFYFLCSANAQRVRSAEDPRSARTIACAGSFSPLLSVLCCPQGEREREGEWAGREGGQR
jgi:hypothetical protein